MDGEVGGSRLLKEHDRSDKDQIRVAYLVARQANSNIIAASKGTAIKLHMYVSPFCDGTKSQRRLGAMLRSSVEMK